MVIGVVATALVPAATARAENGWESKYVAESPNQVLLESGEATTSWFDFRNTGTQTWTRGVVRLGTWNPRDRASAMFDPGTWITTNRPTALDQASVAVGAVGRFTFVARAPAVTAETVYKEYFAPVAETLGWMDTTTYTATWLQYTVRPRVPPTVRLDAAPDSVPFGSPVAVGAAAADNVRVARVEFRLGSLPPVVDTSAPYEAQFGPGGIPEGAQTLTATAFDGLGQSAAVSRTVSVYGVPNGAGASRDVNLVAGFGKRHRPRSTVGYGHYRALTGRLTTSAGAPIAGAALQVATRVVTARRSFRTLSAPAFTQPDGTFRYLAPKGPSRQIRISYTAFNSDAQPNAVRVVRLNTRAGIRLRVSRHTVGPGGSVRFSGRLRGGPKPRRGLLVVLQGKQPGFSWMTFRTARVGPGGRFSAAYRFHTGRRVTFRFRATLREQLGYPYATGRSHEVRVRMR